jgi:hypothetical protein
MQGEEKEAGDDENVAELVVKATELSDSCLTGCNSGCGTDWPICVLV